MPRNSGSPRRPPKRAEVAIAPADVAAAESKQDLLEPPAPPDLLLNNTMNQENLWNRNRPESFS